MFSFLGTLLTDFFGSSIFFLTTVISLSLFLHLLSLYHTLPLNLKLSLEQYIVYCVIHILHMIACRLSHVWLCVTTWAVAWQSPLSMGMFGKNTGVVAIFSSRGSFQPRDRNHISCIPALAGGFFTTTTTWGAHHVILIYHINELLY